MSDMPGASLLVKHLEAYVKKHGQANVAIHMAAHSAGSIYQASMPSGSRLRGSRSRR